MNLISPKNVITLWGKIQEHLLHRKKVLKGKTCPSQEKKNRKLYTILIIAKSVKVRTTEILNF